MGAKGDSHFCGVLPQKLGQSPVGKMFQWFRHPLSRRMASSFSWGDVPLRRTDLRRPLVGRRAPSGREFVGDRRISCKLPLTGCGPLGINPLSSTEFPGPDLEIGPFRCLAGENRPPYTPSLKRRAVLKTTRTARLGGSRSRSFFRRELPRPGRQPCVPRKPCLARPSWGKSAGRQAFSRQVAAGRRSAPSGSTSHGRE